MRHRQAYVYGARSCSGVFGLLIAKPFSMVLRFFPPLVTGTVISVIGLSLIGADISLIAGEQYYTDFKTGTLSPIKSFGTPSHIALAGFVILLIVLITRFTTGFVSQIAVLIAIIVGTVVAWPMGGMIHWGSAVAERSGSASLSRSTSAAPSSKPRRSSRCAS